MAGLEVKIDIGSGAAQAKGGDSSSSSGGVGIPDIKSITGGIKGALKGLGIAAAIGFIADVVLNFKPLVNIVSNIIKMLSLLLRPIADAITILLTPILLLMKPVVRAVNQLMRPFVRLALEFMKKGEFGNATATLFGGIGVVLIKISTELLKLVGSLVISGLAALFGLVSPEAEAALNDQLLPAFFQLVDNQAAIASSFIVMGISKLDEVGSPAIVTFVNDAIDAILDNYPNISTEVGKKINEMRTATIDGDYKKAFTALIDASKTSIGDFGNDAAEAMREAIDGMIKALGISIFGEDAAKPVAQEDADFVVQIIPGTSAGLKFKNIPIISRVIKLGNELRSDEGKVYYF